MNFKEYYLINESFIRELASKYDSLNQNEIDSWSKNLYQLIVNSWTKSQSGRSPGKILPTIFKELRSKRDLSISMLRDLHELEYKQSQLKLYYSNQDIANEANKTLFKIAKWLQTYFGTVLFNRAAGDGVTMEDAEADKTKNVAYVTQEVKKMQDNRPYKNYITPIYLELVEAKTLPQILIAISKAKNAEHDGGNIFNEYLFDGDEEHMKEVFDEISNLNYRKLDRELSQELS